METEKRTKIVTMRLTPSEKEKLQNIITENNIKNISDFIRQIVLTGKFKTTQQAQNYERLLYEINKIGNNLNQIARLCNIDKQVDIRVLEKLSRIEEMLDLLIEECEC
jgi:hypothetical protein